MNQAPDWWWKEEKPPFWIRPFSFFYSQGYSWKKKIQSITPSFKATCPVLSVGSLLLGGSGKTCTIQLLVSFFESRGMKPVIFMRGYKGKNKGPLKVNPLIHSPSDVGEEALLHAGIAPTFIARKRCEALSIFSPQSETVILLDDGHQHHSLHKDISFLVINAHQQWGNGYLFPAGPLREPMEEGLSHAHGIFYLYEDPSDMSSFSCDLPIFPVRALFSSPLPSSKEVIGFAGLGYTKRFHSILKTLFPQGVTFLPFPDHIFYTSAQEHHLARLSQDLKAPLVTTEKDWIKLSPFLQAQTTVVHQTLFLDNPHALEELLFHKTDLSFSVLKRDAVVGE